MAFPRRIPTIALRRSSLSSMATCSSAWRAQVEASLPLDNLMRHRHAQQPGDALDDVEPEARAAFPVRAWAAIVFVEQPVGIRQGDGGPVPDRVAASFAVFAGFDADRDRRLGGEYSSALLSNSTSSSARDPFRRRRRRRDGIPVAPARPNARRPLRSAPPCRTVRGAAAIGRVPGGRHSCGDRRCQASVLRESTST